MRMHVSQHARKEQLRKEKKDRKVRKRELDKMRKERAVTNKTN